MQNLILIILINTLSGEVINIKQPLNEVVKVECPRNRCGSGRRGVLG